MSLDPSHPAAAPPAADRARLAAPAHPPTEPSGRFAPAATSWPVVLGIVGLIFGIGGVLIGVYGMLSPWVTEWLRVNLPPELHATFAAAARYNGPTIAVYAGSVLLGCLLLAGSIGLLKRARWSRRVLLAWGLAKAVHAMPATIIQVMLQNEAMNAAQAQAGGGAAAIAGPPQAIMIGFTIIISLTWLWALPAFVLIWLWRPAIRAECAAWK